ncbi:MAG: ADP-ribosylglycohydrolase family protein [Bryobacteraceae bacterium]|nr:ADP-ribosylglycohydrolase family protein [Bryobacteraceae bacterium]
MDNEISLKGRVRGCLLGRAIGYALGAPVELMRRKGIERRFGAGGMTAGVRSAPKRTQPSVGGYLTC